MSEKMSRLINDWSNETNLLFLRIYFNEPCLWDPRHDQHKNKNSLTAAWDRVSQLMGTNVAELKKKRESLMATFRSHVRKKKATIHAGATGNEVYQPTWFAYDLMESFLGPVYDCNLTNSSLDNNSENSLEGQVKTELEEETSLLAEDAAQQQPTTNNEPGSNIDATLPAAKQTLKTRKRKAYDSADLSGTSAHEAYGYSPVPLMPNIPLSHESHYTDDECDLFCRLLSKKLRKLPETEREVFMYQIDGMFINRMRHMNRPPSPAFSYHVPSPTVQHSVD